MLKPGVFYMKKQTIFHLECNSYTIIFLKVSSSNVCSVIKIVGSYSRRSWQMISSALRLSFHTFQRLFLLAFIRPGWQVICTKVFPSPMPLPCSTAPTLTHASASLEYSVLKFSWQRAQILAILAATAPFSKDDTCRPERFVFFSRGITNYPKML